MPRVNVKDKRKQQLMDATMVSIAKRGLVDTTITHVSDTANMSRGIVNFYFTSKEKMMQETLAFLMGEQTACWQEALAAASAKTPIARVEVIARALTSDKLCSVRRLACLNAFIGHAGTHAGYAKLIRSADDQLIKQVKTLLQQAGIEAKTAELRARQMLAFIRGHHVLAFLNADWGKPSGFSDQWAGVVQGWAGVPESAKEMPTQLKPVTQSPSPKPKKPSSSTNVLPGQLDFGDLFSKL